MFAVMAEALLRDGENNSQFAPSCVVTRECKGEKAKLVGQWTRDTENLICDAIDKRMENGYLLRNAGNHAAATAEFDRAGADRRIFDSVAESHAQADMPSLELREKTHHQLTETFHQTTAKGPQDMSFDDFRDSYDRRPHLGDQMHQTAMSALLLQLSYLPDQESVSEQETRHQMDSFQGEGGPETELRREKAEPEMRSKQQSPKQLQDRWAKEARNAGEVERRVREPTDRFPEHV
jgi:hypothetical protein